MLFVFMFLVLDLFGFSFVVERTGADGAGRVRTHTHPFTNKHIQHNNNFKMCT